jgi:glutathione S-transferase
MKLYGSLTSPYVRKARVLIKEKSLPVELVVEDPWREGTAITGWNPLGKVPVLEVGPGSYLFESTLVTHYLNHLDGAPLEPKDPAGYWQSQWWQALGNGIIDAVIQRVLETRRLPRTQWPEKMLREEQRVHRAVDAAEHAIRKGRFLVGGEFTMADLVMGVALQYTDFRYPHNWSGRAPKLARWYRGIAARSSFKETQPPSDSPGKARRKKVAVATIPPQEAPPPVPEKPAGEA